MPIDYGMLPPILGPGGEPLDDQGLPLYRPPGLPPVVTKPEKTILHDLFRTRPTPPSHLLSDQAQRMAALAQDAVRQSERRRQAIWDIRAEETIRPD